MPTDSPLFKLVKENTTAPAQTSISYTLFIFALDHEIFNSSTKLMPGSQSFILESQGVMGSSLPHTTE